MLEEAGGWGKLVVTAEWLWVFFWGWWKCSRVRYIDVMVGHHCDCTKDDWIVHLKMAKLGGNISVLKIWKKKYPIEILKTNISMENISHVPSI